MTDRTDGIEIRVPTTDEMPQVITATERAFGGDTDADRIATEMAILPAERSLAAFDGSDVVASAGILTFDMTAPGGPIPVAGVTMVGVLPTHRRRGIMSSFLRRQLTELHDQQAEPVAALWAAEASIYRRFGYGRASMHADVSVTSGLPFVDGAPAPLPLRLCDITAARERISAIYDSARVQRPGMTTRTTARWDAILDDTERVRQGASSLTCAVLDNDHGYVVYRTKGSFEDGLPAGKVTVNELIATDPAAYATLWRYLLDIDLMKTVQAWNRPVDDPLQHLVSDARRTLPKLGDSLWVRLVDVQRALSARTYGAAGALTVELVDVDCPWNAGTYSIEVDAADSAHVRIERTQRSADLTMSAAELGAVYLGGTRLRDLAAAGFVDEHTPGAVIRADRMFVGTVEPWCAEIF